MNELKLAVKELMRQAVATRPEFGVEFDEAFAEVLDSGGREAFENPTAESVEKYRDHVEKVIMSLAIPR